MAAVKLSAKSVGSIVKIRVNNTAREFIVVHQGKPSSIYDDSCNDTWLLMKDIYETRQWHSSKKNDYANSTLHSYLNSTLLNLFDSNIRSVIKQVRIPYRPGSGTSTNVNTGASGLSAKIFLLSCYEVGCTAAGGTKPIADGAKLSYFESDTGSAANNKRIGYLNGTATIYWLRTPSHMTGETSYRVLANGTCGTYYCSNAYGIRPALVLPSSLSVADDGTLITNTAPSAPSSISPPSTVKSGVNFTVSWSASSDADGNLQGYIAERALDGGSWSQIYQGGSTSMSDYISYGAADVVQYRVHAYDTQGASSGYTYSSTKTIVHNLAPSTPPAITVPMTVKGGEPLTVTWSAATDNDGNLSGYQLSRQSDGGSWTQLYSGAAQSYTDNITKGWTSVAYRVRAYDALNAYSGYRTSDTRTISNNTPPAITCAQKELGEQAGDFTIRYTVADADGDAVTVTEKLDDTILRTFTAAPGQENVISFTGIDYVTLLNGQHTLTVTATDSENASAAHTVTFSKSAHTCEITLTENMPVDDVIKKTLLSVTRLIPAGAEFKVLVTNNANDDQPVWEDATSSVLSNKDYIFENAESENGFAYNFKITASRGESATGGYIGMIGGAFQ